MPRIETALDSLERRLVELTALRRRMLKGAEVEALAECAFRIAVHPTTATGRAAELLRLAMRTDPANPKYSYHMARLYFRSGDFENAGDWLNRARKLCPTSHRIWTHIGLLQREVNESHNRKYREKKGYLQDEHKRRWKEISEGIGKGSDQFDLLLARFEPDYNGERSGVATQIADPPDPPGSEAPEQPAERLTNAGVCRWTRILDLTADDLLEADAGSRTRDAMRGLMERAAANSDSRIGGKALFCVLAIEWMLRGYSPQFIRRIRPHGVDESAADVLLNDVLQLIKTPSTAMPEALAAALDAGKIPPVLAAAIHRHFVFGPPLDSGKLIADLREARVAARNAPAEACASWLGTLGEDAAFLKQRPTSLVADFPTETEEKEAGPEATVAAITQLLKRTLEDTLRFRKWLDERLSKQLEAMSDEETLEANRIREFVNGVPALRQQALADLKRLRDSGTGQAFAEAIESLEDGLQGISVKRHSFLIRRYRQVDARVTQDGTSPSAAAAAVPPAITASWSEGLPDPLKEEIAATPQELRARLAGVIEETEKRLIGLFDVQVQTAAAYSRFQAAEPALRAIRMSVVARKAETLYRLRKRGEARRQWAALLTEDIFDLRVLRNLAIVDTVEGDVRRYQASWRNYLEMLYFQAVALQDVGYLAAERESLHKNYGNAYGFKNLYEEKGGADAQKPTDGTDLLAFVSNPGSVRLYMRHQFLAILNRRLMFRLPPLVLGVSRSSAEQASEEARQKMQTWCEGLCLMLPKRAADRFSETIRQWLTSAVEGMKSNKRLRELAGRGDFQEEQTKYLQWIADVFQWKVRLYSSLEPLAKYSGQSGYLDLLVEFAEADSIPLDTSDELLQAVAMKLKNRPEVICSLMERGCTNALVELLRIVFPKNGIGEPGTEEQRRSLYTRLTGELAGTRLVGKARQMIDNPGEFEVFEFYPKHVQQAISSGKVELKDIEYLEALHQHYPASGGITFHYALVLVHSQRVAEAKRVAAVGVASAFHKSSRKECQDILDQIRSAGG